MDIGLLLNDHIERFNRTVLSGNFDEMVAHFTDDAIMSFEGVAVGPFQSRDAVAAACSAQPPDDQLVVLEVLEKGDDSIESSYGWAIAPDRRA